MTIGWKDGLQNPSNTNNRTKEPWTSKELIPGFSSGYFYEGKLVLATGWQESSKLRGWKKAIKVKEIIT